MGVTPPAPGEIIKGPWTSDQGARLDSLEGPAWTAVPLQNTWTAGTTTPSVRKLGPNNVQFVGYFNIGATKADGTTVGVLPAGYRPLHDMDVLLSATATVSGGQNPHLNLAAATGNMTCWGISTSTGAGVNVIFPTNL